MRVIIGGVGYRDLRDHSIGVLIADRLIETGIGPDVVVEDLSFNPIAVMQRLQDEPAEGGFERAIFVGAVPRGGLRTPGSVTVYRWDGALPDAEEIQRAVSDAVTGIINLDNTLVVTHHFGALPPEVVVVEIEPEAHEFGETLSECAASVFDPACAIIRRLATERAAIDTLTTAPLGGGSAVSLGVW